MSSGRAPPGLGLDAGGLWHQRAMQSRSLVRTYLLSTPVPPLPRSSGPRLRDALHLPSLTVVKPAHNRTTVVPLSISQPSLFTPGHRVAFEGFSRNRRPPLRRRAPPLPLCKSCDAGGKDQSCRPVYTHFSCPIRPCSQSQTLTKEKGGLRPLVMQYRQAPQVALSVRGKPCLPSQPSPPAAPPKGRTQLHVFLPTEGIGEEKEGDSESVDEGFMDELDSKVTSLRLQQRESKTTAYPDLTSSLLIRSSQ